ncbi:MAG: glucosyl-3-phosphoglycerate synthase [Chloroflexi bacterium]|nr:glucosyl-3-phosphoglycerate synthase [Chloroflexota bacterium]
MGAIARPQRGDPPIGPTAQSVLKQINIPALVVKSRAAKPLNAITEPATPVDYTISVVVDKWFAENTFHAHEFENIQQLVDLKERQGLTISLGLPTLNEEATIGNVIKTMRAKFVREYPLIDEIVVIDSNSTDCTVEIAEQLGVPVARHPEILPQYGVWAGKGEALWNSLYILKGDLIAWIDTDIVNIHPRFVYGILGPLIREPRLMYVKGFYQRPLRLGRKMEARGGGRVTELTARPLLNLFYPELSGFVQPLAGEYAGRREALEAVPFFVGYGVETGLLIDILNQFGLSAMGQVDLEERVHRNQSLHALSKMAFEITQVVLQRVGETRGVELIQEENKSMKLIRHEADAFQLDVADIRARERPPMLTIPEYRALRGLEGNA